MGIKYTMTAVVLKSAEARDLLVARGAGVLVIDGETAVIKKTAAQFESFLA